LNLIEKAKLVITSRLHILAPALAFGTKVIFLPHGNNSDHSRPEYSKNRYAGIVDLINNPEKLKDLQDNLSKLIINKIYSNN
jgi:hypothetical protein